MPATSTLFPSTFTPFTVQTQSSPDVSISGIRSSDSSSSLPPLLLLHGYPETHHMWHTVAPQLTSHFSLVIMDIRGYGASSKPANNTALYAKSHMANDCIAVMDALGYANQPFYVCGHDRGARITHKLLVDHPTRIRKAILLDICPTLAMYNCTHPMFPKAYFHWYFLIQQSPLPETLINGAPRQVVEGFMSGMGSQSLSMFHEDALAEYIKCMEDEDYVHATCQDYRAAATHDLDEQKDDLAKGKLIQSPIRVLLGKNGIVNRLFDGKEEWTKVTAEGVPVEVEAVDSGHFIPEQIPDVVVSNILDFFQ
ncbi:alpha/beta hydrolase fold domain-containing protein [Trichoderma breve]|uniref:Alpha/beta hydrolase fold domain-containing protein n=1 Tax=Trichoderma breve TaxID=2034170 RepID=A0A9W9JRT8_9HYPO|nr:alpha/beta hydrolase fold domain-containing protein [Trichoderma breve]KAJ4865289.1 alpha/beta hydrolase fold domain-containing protein [Trichoderma breve]